MATPTERPKGLFKGTNFMTPTILGYYRLRKGLGYAELSEGRGLVQQPIFGVSVATHNSTKVSDLSKLFYSKANALDYIDDLS